MFWWFSSNPFVKEELYDYDEQGNGFIWYFTEYKDFDELYDFSQENFTGIRVIKAFVKENKEILAFSKVAKHHYGTELKFVKLSVGFDVIIELIFL